MAVRNPTQWYPLNGTGFVQTQGTLPFVDNLGNFIVDNLGNNIVTTPTYVVPRFATAWTSTGV